MGNEAGSAAPAPAAAPATPAPDNSGGLDENGMMRAPAAAAKETPGQYRETGGRPDGVPEDLELPEEEGEGASETEGGEAAAAGAEGAAEETPEAALKEGEEKPLPLLEQKVKVKLSDGTETEATVAQLVELHGKAEGAIAEANKVIDEYQALQASSQKLVKDLHEDFTTAAYRALVEKHGGDQDKAWQELVTRCDAVVAEAIKWEKLPPEKREAIDAKREAERYKAEAEKLRKERDEETAREKQAEQAERFFKVARPALEKAGLQPTEAALQRIIDIYSYNARLGKKPTIEGCAALLKKELDGVREGLRKEALEGDPDAFITKYPDFARRINEAAVRRVKRERARSAGGPANGSAARGQASEPEEQLDLPSGLSTAEFFRRLDKVGGRNPKR